MPCYIVNLVSVEFNPKYKELLFKALKRNKIDYFVYKEKEIIIKGKTSAGNSRMLFSILDGKVMIDKSMLKDEKVIALLNEVKKSYSREVLALVTKKMKWKVNKATGTKKEAYILSR